ncbi:MAG: noncanonical pyrimidine nucleotidase, YjjG family [Flavobacteriales bacterium]|nr:noncanonical pyrimidine nucleotidase, YjjG family [Flavobacteriales bacterium]|tara:strand:- start:1312 stop:2001 length:690 start_codon:yes stop_codon:yes gene_type:complete
MIKHIFFDLDRTLWDFETNSHETLLEICNNYHLKEKGILDYEEFINTYKIHNEKLWDLYRVDAISQKDLRRERFQRTLADFGINDFNLSEKIGEDYIIICPRKNKLYPFAMEILDYLKEKYILHIITNGFNKTQHTKLKHSNLRPYFDQIITSEKTGVKKPNPAIFDHALKLAKSTKEESVYIGDDLVVDILACQNFGIKGIYFNPEKREHKENVAFEIACLSQIKEIL